MTSRSGDMPAVRLRHRVEWIDTDAAGIYHNRTVLRFVESAEAELMRSLGIEGYFHVAPRVHLSLDYESPLFFEQEATTLLQLSNVGATSLKFDFEVWGEAIEGRPRRRAAKGNYVTVHLPSGHTIDGKSQAWPADWSRRFRGTRTVDISSRPGTAVAADASIASESQEDAMVAVALVEKALPDE